MEQRSSFAVSIPLIEQNKKDVLSEIENIKINSESLKDKLANYKIPEVILFTTEALPRIASEKIDRVSVKNLLS